MAAQQTLTLLVEVRVLYPQLNKIRFLILFRSVAQLGRALRSGRRGRVFESRHSDFQKKTVKLHEMQLYGFFIIKISDSFFWRSLEYDYFGTTPSEVTLTVLLRPGMNPTFQREFSEEWSLQPDSLVLLTAPMICDLSLQQQNGKMLGEFCENLTLNDSQKCRKYERKCKRC